MPMYQAGCICGYRGDKFLHREFDRQQLYPCPECNNTLSWIPSFGRGITWFEEGRARVITNLCHEPVVVTSYTQHEKLMKEHGVALAGQRRGMPGCWA